jgi:serine/threonine protein phosphatase PrpC
MNFAYAASTDPGLLRENNEDSVAFEPIQGVAVLADGMGGYNAGEIASAMAVTFVKAELSRWLEEAASQCSTSDIRQAMEACVVNANQAIYNAANANPQFSGMGTTIVVGVFGASRVLLAHVGDSRCYLWRDAHLTQLTRDHSLLQEQIEAGLLTAEQAKVASHKNLVTRALGVEEGVMVEIIEHTPLLGDVYLMCSDGLSDMVDDENLEKVLLLKNSLADQTQALVRAANEAGGRDNISVILIAAAAESGQQGFFSRILRRP